MSYGDGMKIKIADKIVPPKIPLGQVVFGSAFRINTRWFLLTQYENEDGELGAMILSGLSVGDIEFFDANDCEVDEVRPVTISF